MMYANNYYGLKKRPDYDEIVDYLHNKQPKIKYPDRLATFIRRTNQMSNLLDGEGYSLFDLEMQQAKTIALLKTGIIGGGGSMADSEASVAGQSQLPPNPKYDVVYSPPYAAGGGVLHVKV